MTALQAAVEGLIQGLTEFLPVSSSGHLLLGSRFLGLPVPGLSFSIMLHFGTALAVIVMLRQEILWVLRGLLFPTSRSERISALKLTSFVAIASVPAGLVGIFASDLIERSFSSGGVAALGLIVTGFILRLSKSRASGGTEEAPDAESGEPAKRYPSYRARRRPPSRSGSMPSVTLERAVLVGLAQAFAIIPGVSRSGTTITAGLRTGIRREDASRFSFLLSLPATLGALLLDLRARGQGGPALLTPSSIVGTLVSFVAGMFALMTVVKAVQKGELSSFSWYCWIAGTVSLVWLGFF